MNISRRRFMALTACAMIPSAASAAVDNRPQQFFNRPMRTITPFPAVPASQIPARFIPFYRRLFELIGPRTYLDRIYNHAYFEADTGPIGPLWNYTDRPAYSALSRYPLAAFDNNRAAEEEHWIKTVTPTLSPSFLPQLFSLAPDQDALANAMHAIHAAYLDRNRRLVDNHIRSERRVLIDQNGSEAFPGFTAEQIRTWRATQPGTPGTEAPTPNSNAPLPVAAYFVITQNALRITRDDAKATTPILNDLSRFYTAQELSPAEGPDDPIPMFEKITRDPIVGPGSRFMIDIIRQARRDGLNPGSELQKNQKDPRLAPLNGLSAIVDAYMNLFAVFGFAGLLWDYYGAHAIHEIYLPQARRDKAIR